MSPAYALLVIAAVTVCVLLAWIFIFRKRVAKYRNLSSNQGERYRQFFDNCPDTLLVVEHDGSIVTANANASSLLRMDGQDLLAKNFWDFVTGVSRSEFGKQFKSCITGKKMRCEGFVEAFDGAVVPVVVNGSLQHIDGKRLVQLYIRDNSVLREVEDQVRSLYNQLDTVVAELEEKEKTEEKKALRVRKDFLAFANHQIRTPLDGIMGMAQLLSDTPLSIEQHNCVYTILKSSAGLLNVIRSMGDAPEDTSEGGSALKAELVNLREVCEVLSIRYKPLAVHKGIDFRCDCQGNVPLHVVTDGQLLNQVLSALLDNAIKFTAQGLVMLNIECRRKSDHDAELYFHVIDTGIGIDKEFQSLVFEQCDPVGDNEFARWDGGGLGLAASRSLVELMGGTIDLISTKGKGSTFFFSLTLPLALPQSAVDTADQADADVVFPTGGIDDAAVLVVDDNKICHKVVASMLRKVGFEVEAVENGKDALAKIQQKHYDVVLMDCQMPVMDGFEATTSIRAMPEPYRSIPILALTAHSLKHELQACRECGMDGHLVKPVDRQKLIDTVTRFAKKGRQASLPAYKAAS